MRLLLLFLLQFSLVLCLDRTKLGKDELYLDLDGFPAGSLLTFYFKTKTQTNPTPGIPNEIAIDLYESFQEASSANLHFRLNLKDNTLLTDYRATSVGESGWKNEVTRIPWLAEGTPVSGERWMRFDLYRIEDTKFLVFFQGFLANFAQNPRELIVKKSITSVHIKPYKNQPLNFYKEDVYISIKIPSSMPKPEMVLTALDSDKVAAARAKSERLDQTKLTSFSIGTTIALSALLVSNDVNHENHAGIYFFNEAKDWALGVANKGPQVQSEPVVLFLNRKKKQNNDPEWLKSSDESEKCAGITILQVLDTSTDIVHVKLTRPDKNKIEMRLYYIRDKYIGIVCSIVVSDEEAGFLDRPLTVEGADSGTLLHMAIEPEPQP